MTTGRRCVAALAVGVALAGAGALRAGPAAADELDDLRASVTTARAAATAATERYMDAVNRLEAIEVEIAAAEREIEFQREVVAVLAALARDRAVAAYTSRGVDLGFDLDRPLDRVRREKLLERANARDNDTIARLDDATEALQRREAGLRTLRSEARTTRDELAAEQAQLDEQLGGAEQALAAFEERLAREEAARQERERALLAAQQQAARAPAASGRGAAPSGSGNAYVPGGLICPIRGPVSFVDSWGAPRSTTGRHQGVDLMSPRGTANVAVVPGEVQMRSGATSGLGAWLYGDDGNLYWYFHLDAYEGGSRRVQQGDVLGYTGNTGDASGGAPHTHFEIHPGGGPAVNPYPTVASIC